MATTEAAPGDLREQLRDYWATAADIITGPGLWIFFISFGTWALLFETTAFVIGVVTGSVFALGAIGLTLIFGILRFAHFAHGDSMMLSGYLAFFALTGVTLGTRRDTDLLPVSLSDLPGATDPILGFSFGYGLLLAMIMAAVVMAGLFLLLDRLIYRHLRARKSGIVIFAIASLGTAIAMRGFMLLAWGPNPRFYFPGIRPTTELPILGVRVVTDQIFIFCAAILVAIAVYYLLFRTRLGKAMRAMSDNPDLAKVSGINTDWTIRWTWIFGGTLVAIAGVLLALQAQLAPQLGFVLLLPLFAATILGGIGSPQGAFLGGMIVGISQEVAVTFGFVGAGYKFSIAFIILVFILLFRPRGLLGGKDT